MDQHQREYQDSYRGGRRDRLARDDEGRWPSRDSGRSRQPYEAREDYDSGSRRFEPHHVGEDERSQPSSSRGREWTSEGRGGYGGESGDYERGPSRWHAAGTSWRGGSSYGEYGEPGGGGSGFARGRHAGESDDARVGATHGDESWRGVQERERDYGSGAYGGGLYGSGQQKRYRSGQYGGGQYGDDWGRRSSRPGWQSNASPDWPQPRGSSGYGRDAGEYVMGGTYEGEPQRGRSVGRSGAYAGLGPKNYHRSDDRIREEISDRMTDDGDLDASDITVQVQKGEVTLTGTVRSRDQKRRAEDVAEQVSGVSDVVNNIRVPREEGASRSSAWQSAQSTSQSQPTGSSSSQSNQPNQPNQSNQASHAGQKSTGKSGGSNATA
jgi:osmotically-inducible protein OsmY